MLFIIGGLAIAAGLASFILRRRLTRAR